MCPMQKQIVTEEMLCKFLQEGAQSKELAHFFLETIGPEGAEWLTRRILEPEVAELPTGNAAFASMIGARQLDPEKKRLLEVNTLFNYFNHRKQLLANSLSAQEAARLLSVSRQTVHERIRDGKLVGLLENNTMKLPTFQFDPAGPNGVLAGLPEVIAAMNTSVIGKISWMVTPSAVFEGKTPVDILKQGRLEEVLRESRSVGVA